MSVLTLLLLLNLNIYLRIVVQTGSKYLPQHYLIDQVVTCDHNRSIALVILFKKTETTLPPHHGAPNL